MSLSFIQRHGVVRSLRSAYRTGWCNPARLVFVAVTLMGGCARLPHTPVQAPLDTPFGFADSVAKVLAGPQFRAGDWPAPDWWKAFGDPALDALVTRSLTANPDMKIAEARVRDAQQIAALAYSATRPDLSGEGSYTRERLSRNGLIPPFFGSTINQYQLSLNLDYDFDVWGRNRQIVRARLSEIQAASAELEESRLVLSCAVAQTWFNLQGTLATLKIARDTLRQRSELLHLVQARFSKGLDTELPVRQTEAEVFTTRDAIVNLQLNSQLGRNQLAALSGQGPDQADARATPIGSAPGRFPLPGALPIDLLGRRPDITARRWQVEAAAREIGAARASFYPDINLSALAGLQSLSLARLFQGGSLLAQVGPAIHLPIFEGGSLRARLGARYAEYDIAVQQYNAALLNAAQGVANQLATVDAVRRRAALQTLALRAVRQAYQITLVRYQHGVSDYLNVLQADRDVLTQRNAAAQLQEARLQSTLALIKELGGGYRTGVVSAPETSN